jgi:hypothetical protein
MASADEIRYINKTVNSKKFDAGDRTCIASQICLKFKLNFATTANHVPKISFVMLTGAFCRDGDAAAASLIVLADEVAIDIPLLLGATPRPSPLRGKRCEHVLRVSYGSEARRVRSLLVSLRFLTGAFVSAVLARASAVANLATPATGRPASGHHNTAVVVDLHVGVDCSPKVHGFLIGGKPDAAVMQVEFGPHLPLRGGYIQGQVSATFG